MERQLEKHPQQKVRVIAVWEPILRIDWSPPSTASLHRLTDHRVVQFWDKQHVVAKLLAESRGSDSPPDCCVRKGVLWDLIAVYPAGAIWGKSPPPAILFNGPVVRVIADQTIF